MVMFTFFIVSFTLIGIFIFDLNLNLYHSQADTRLLRGVRCVLLVCRFSLLFGLFLYSDCCPTLVTVQARLKRPVTT